MDYLKKNYCQTLFDLLANSKYHFVVTGGSTWMHLVRSVKKDAVCVSRLRSCGVILLGKANMHEFGMGTTGNNPNYG